MDKYALETKSLKAALGDRLLAFSELHPDVAKRPWYMAIRNSPRWLPEGRKSVPCENPFLACLEFAERERAFYCEGVILRTSDDGAPKPAVWASTPSGIVCFTHLLDVPHALAGLVLDDDRIRDLYRNQGIAGPYMFDPRPEVVECLIGTALKLGGQTPQTRH